MGEVVDFAAYKAQHDQSHDPQGVFIGVNGSPVYLETAHDMRSIFEALGLDLPDEIVARYFPGDTDG